MSGANVGGTGNVVLVATTVVVLTATVEPIVITTGEVPDESSVPTVSTRLGSSSPPAVTSSAATPRPRPARPSPRPAHPTTLRPASPILRQAQLTTMDTDKGLPGSTTCGARLGPSGGPV